MHKIKPVMNWSFLMVCFVYWHANLCVIFNSKALFVEKQQWYYLT